MKQLTFSFGFCTGVGLGDTAGGFYKQRMYVCVHAQENKACSVSTKYNVEYNAQSLSGGIYVHTYVPCLVAVCMGKLAVVVGEQGLSVAVGVWDWT